MNRQRRFHIIFAVHYLRYGLLLCLVPMLQALLAFDLDSLWAALRQDACCFAKRMRKVFRKNEKSMLQNCNKKAKRKGRLQRVKKPM